MYLCAAPDGWADGLGECYRDDGCCEGLYRQGVVKRGEEE